MTPARAPLVAGVAVACLVSAAVALAWRPGSPVAPVDGSWSPAGSAPAFLLLLALAFVAYAAGVRLLRRGAPIAAVVAIAVVVQVVPVGAPLLLSTDAWTYWAYGRMASEGEGNPYRDPPGSFPGSPATPYVGADWLDTTTVYGPAFTLASEPISRVIANSQARAAWLFKALAAAATLAAAVLAARVAAQPALAVALVGWNPVLAVHMGGGGHNDAWVGALLAAALVLVAAGRSATSGVVWAIAVFVKWIPLLFLLLALLAPPRRRRPHALALAVAGTTLAALATWRYGLAWAGALGPLAGNAARETSYAIPARLTELGLPEAVSLGLAVLAFVAGIAWLALQSRRGKPRLGVAACLVLATTPYLAVWYLGWAVPLAAADDDDRLAVIGALAFTAYLLPQTIPL